MTRSGHDVLLVEDNPDDVKLTLLAFEEIGFRHRISVATDGAEALDYLLGRGRYRTRRPPAPVLVLLDLNLPKIHGLEILRTMRRDPRLKHIVVAVLTSSDEESDRTEALKLGANIYLRKALDYADFISVVRQVDGVLSALK